MGVLLCMRVCVHVRGNLRILLTQMKQRLSQDIGTKALFPSENIVNIHHLLKSDRKCCTEQISELQRIPVKYFFSTEIDRNISLVKCLECPQNYFVLKLNLDNFQRNLRVFSDTKKDYS
ncbi:Hypothetical predicted protein [Octopus vulgaris]|uniref:Uncharacterized protein n=1 Tax=Octopus vulgaris TaxID=6645 RepID=A0AA36FLY9_OCTVU|nr:Hypothetical predicted protein [Octopus vulgaris]